MHFTFRALEEADLPTLHRWLNDPEVVRWWEGDDVSWPSVVADYGPNSEAHIEHYIATRGADDVGWIQCYPVAEEPAEAEPWRSLGLDEGAVGIDYLVGEPDLRGSGVGSEMIRHFVRDVVFGRHPEWTQVAADPMAANVASWKALERAGFRFVGEIDNPLGASRLMMMNRDDG